MVSKLRLPAVSERPVPRQRLLERVSAAAAGPLTLVSAPAGAGKTLLVSSWAAGARGTAAIAWVSLDDGDDQPGTFWSYVVEALYDSGVPLVAVTAPLEVGPVDRSFLVRLVAGLSELTDPVVLVLDSAEVVTTSEIWDDVAFLLEHAAPLLRLVVVTRTDPPLPLHRYRLTGAVTEIRLDELAFTPSEAGVLLSGQGFRISAGELVALTQRTRGWAAGLRLAAASWRAPGQANHGPLRVDGRHRVAGDLGDLADYLRAEVLDQQPADVRDFLLRTSIADHLPVGLAEELTGRPDSARICAALTHANAFIEACVEHTDCYRYHPLFRELLGAQLSYQSPDAVAPLHAAAARWLAAAGRLPEAAGHAARAGDWERAAMLLVDGLAVATLLAGPHAEDLRQEFAAMPASAAGPAPAVVHAALAVVGDDAERCAKHLSRATELVADGSPERTTALQLAVATVEAVLARGRADLEAAVTATGVAETALAELSAAGVAPPPENRAVVLTCAGSTLLWAGELDTAARTLAAAVAAASWPGGEYLKVCGLGQLALLEAMRGRLRKATELGTAAAALAERSGLPAADQPAAAEVALAWVHTEEYDLATARRHAKRASQRAGARNDPVVAAALELTVARLLQARGDLAGAVGAIAEATTSLRSVPPWLEDRLTAAAAVLDVAAGRPETAVNAAAASRPEQPYSALAVARARLAQAQTAPASAAASSVLRSRSAPLDALVEGWLLQASCELANGAADRASVAVGRALRLAEPERLTRAVLDAPLPVRQFLRRQPQLTARHGWLGDRLGGGTPARTGPASGPSTAVSQLNEAVIVEPLTEKEREVLVHLAALLSTEEIAGAMFVSVNTVKTHVRGILRKLAVSRRNEAIRRARQLRLI